MYTAQLEAAARQYMIDTLHCMQEDLTYLLNDCDLKADKAIAVHLQRLNVQIKSLNTTHKAITTV